MHWDYRIVRRTTGNQEYVGIHEAHYDLAGNITVVTQEPVTVSGKTVDDLRETLSLMQKALEQDVIEMPLSSDMVNLDARVLVSISNEKGHVEFTFHISERLRRDPSLLHKFLLGFVRTGLKIARGEPVQGLTVFQPPE